MIQVSAIANIINDDSFVEAMKELKQLHLDIICNSESDEDKIREIAYMKIVTVNEIMAHLQSIADGKKIKDKQWKI